MSQEHYHIAAGDVMGGPWQIRHRRSPAISAAAVARAAGEALLGVDLAMSTYRHDSELMALNAAGLGTEVPVSEELYDVISCACELGSRTGGAIDITLGRLVNAWGFGPGNTPAQAPSVPGTSASMGEAGYSLNPAGHSVVKHRNFAFDLCALAKGFAVDQAAAAVRALGVSDFLIEAAGEIYCSGDGPDGKGWGIGLELPVRSEERLVFDEVRLRGACASTGSYRNIREIGGEEYSHTLDPKTGTPLRSDLLSVTVLHDSCMHADALATALFVLGEKDGAAFAQTEQIAALFLTRVPTGLRETRTPEFVIRTRCPYR